jgi:uncharacterized protein involved in exopolysaccharide biosynthesis
MTNEQEKNDTNDEVSLKELILKLREWWRYLWIKKWIIITAGITGGLLGFGYAFIKKPVYTATTTFVLESGDKGGGLGQYAGVASMMGIDLGGVGGGIFQGDNILELYKSRTMLEKTLFSPLDSISKLSLIERFIEVNDIRKGWEKKPNLKNLVFKVENSSQSLNDEKNKRLRDSVIAKVVESIRKNVLSVSKPDKKLNIIKVDTRSFDELFAKRFNEELVKNVNDFYVQTKTKKSLENVAILQHKTDSVRAVMNGAIYSAAAVSDATPNLNPTRQVQRVAPVQRAQFSAETNKAILSEMLKNLEMGKMALLKETPLIQVIDKPVYPLEKEKKSKILTAIAFGFFLSMLTIIYLALSRIIKNATC